MLRIRHADSVLRYAAIELAFSMTCLRTGRFTGQHPDSGWPR